MVVFLKRTYLKTPVSNFAFLVVTAVVYFVGTNSSVLFVQLIPDLFVMAHCKRCKLTE